MSGDLGAWPPAQATVLLEVLKKDGLDPEAKRTRDGIQVTVPDEQLDRANLLLVKHMDEIAQAARSPGGARRKPRAAAAQGRQRPRAPEPPLPTERLTRLGRPLGLFLVLLLLTVIAPVALRLPLLIFGVAGIIYLLGKQAQREGRDGPP